MMAKTIGIISIKGGVGKTSTVSALGAALANNFNKRVLLIDGNFSAPNLGLHLGLLEPEVTLHHVLNEEKDVKDAIYDTEYGFHFLPGSLISKKINPFKLKHKIEPLKKLYDVIIIDSSPSLNEELLSTMIASDELYVITTPDVVTLSTTLRAIRLAKQKNIPIKGIILNKVYNKDFELGVGDIEKTAECNVVAILPHDVKVLEALSQNIPVSLHEDNKVREEYIGLAGALIGAEYKKKGVLGRIKKFFGFYPKHEINRLLLVEENR